MGLATIRAVVTIPKVGLNISYDADRPWRQKWRDVVAGIAELEQIYDQESMNNEDVRRKVEDFFADLREIADWLEEDEGTSDGKAFVLTNPDLHIADGMAQVTKHHTRRKRPSLAEPDPIAAHVSRIESGHGVRAEIHWTSAGGKRGVEDALDLGRRCVSAWLTFLASRGLDPEA